MKLFINYIDLHVYSLRWQLQWTFTIYYVGLCFYSINIVLCVRVSVCLFVFREWLLCSAWSWCDMHFWYSLYMTLSRSVCLSVGTSGPDVTFGTTCVVFYLSVCLSVGTSFPDVTFRTACVVFNLSVCRD